MIRLPFHLLRARQNPKSCSISEFFLLLVVPIFKNALSPRPSIKNIQSFRSAGFTDPMIRQSSLSSKRPGSSTVVAGSQTPFALPRKMRARGMTDGGSTQKAGFFSAERPALSQKSSISTFSSMPSTEHNPPRVAIKQPYPSRLFTPPCAPPPIHSLPATPHSPTKIFSPMQKSARFDRTESISSSSISFVSSSSNEMFPVPSFTMREKGTSDRSIFSQDYNPEISPSPAKPESKTAPSSPRVLKKTISHQSLGKSSVLLPTSSKLPPDNMIEKVFRKQRSFHHTRSPMPPISDPLDQPSSPISMPFSSSNGFGPKAEVTTEQRREKGNCSLSIGRRKRLFSHSGSPRPSTSQCTPISATTEDDSQSVFSLRSDRSCHLVSFKPWTPQAAPQSSFWDESGSPVPSSPSRSTPDYMPQPILSPAEVAKLEASIENSSHRSSRSRAPSLLSTLTAASDREDVEAFPAGLSPPPTARPHSKQGSSTVRTPALYSPVSSRARSPANSPPSPNKGNPESDSRSITMYQPSESPMTSLPPPPRSRRRSSPLPNPENDARSTIPYRPPESPTLFTTSLPPPPRSRQRSQLIIHPGHRGPVPLRSNSFSIAKRSRSKSAAEKDTHHRSIMRKSSFLEIDDDTDQDIDMFSGKAITESFLDFAKESFEASRSDDS